MLKQSDQVDVWEGLVSSATRSQCFGDLCNRYNFYNKVLVWLTLFFSWAAASVVLKDWLPLNYQWVRFALPLATAGLTFLSVLQQYQKRASDCLDLYFRWNQLATRFDALWNDMDASDVPVTISALKEKSAELSKASVPFGRHNRLMLKCQRAIEEQYSQQVPSANAAGGQGD